MDISASTSNGQEDGGRREEMDTTRDLTSQFGESALEELKQLGVQTFQASAFETNVVRQMGEQMEVEGAYRASKELQKMKHDMENLKDQVSRLKAQCFRLSKQDHTDNEVKELYRECLDAYRKRKAEINVLEQNMNLLMADIDTCVQQQRASKEQLESGTTDGFQFDLGMRTTTTQEQESLLLAQRLAHSTSDTSGAMNHPESNEMSTHWGEDVANEKRNQAKRKHFEIPESMDISETLASETPSPKRILPIEEGISGKELDVGRKKSKTTKSAKRGALREEEEDEDYEDVVEELLDEFQAPKNDDEEIDDESSPNVGSQRVKRTLLGDTGDMQPGAYRERVERWLTENKDDPRSKELRKLKKWLHVRNKALYRRGDLSEQETQLLARPMPIRKVSVSKNDSIPSVKFEGGFEIPKHIYKKLFEHQRVAVRWLWELHQQEAGGILGDEMGLGKTLETIAFLSGLAYSGLLTGPILITCPTTVVAHWLREFHWWAPEFNVLTFRGSGETVPITPVLERCADVFNQPNAFTQIYEEIWDDIQKSLQVEIAKPPPKASTTSKSTGSRKKSNGRGGKKRKFELETLFGEEADENDVIDVEGDGGDDLDKILLPENVEQGGDALIEEALGQKYHCERPKLDEMEQSHFDRVDGQTPVVLIMSYETVRMNIAALSRVHWHYAIMDEGHKLRNPEAGITVACKRLPTPHRMLLTGTPIQNSLVELWSLFDFCFPGKLGTLETFQQHFAWPIQRGGYANASPMEVRVAYKCAVTLRDLVNPYLLRRSKEQVKIELPEKSEQILFCQLTERQREAYKVFLRSNDAAAVYEGLRNMLYGIDILRKICNHTFLNESDHGAGSLMHAQSLAELTDGSAKLKVLNHVLGMWKEQNHRVLLFTQTIQMLNIVEKFVQLAGYRYMRMDGHTAAAQRQKLVDKFNEASFDDPEAPFIFLLTTRVGGLGINLTSANRVIVYDPDWNPMTDLQAKERAFRIGQTRNVIVYRLVTSGTIEEKIYHRQVFKQFLTQKILRDPKQTRSFFQSSGLRDLFRLNEKPGNALHEDDLTQIPHEETAIDDSDVEDDDLGNFATSGSRDSSDAFKRSKKRKTPKPKDGDGWLLGGLMGQEISSKLDHEAVLDRETGHGKGGSDGVEGYVEQEAENLASKAVEMLRMSRHSSGALASSLPSSRSAPASDSRAAPSKPRFGTVSRGTAKTTTAKAGSSNALPRVSGLGASTAKTGLSGAELIQSLKDNSVSPLVETQAQLVLLKDFFIKLGGIASSQQIADWFRDKVPQKQLLLFRSLLRKVADFDANTRYWTLKPWAGGATPEGQGAVQ
jgi:DNA excision repair protein ERCC-6